MLAKSKETNKQKLTKLAVEPTTAWHGILKYPQLSLNISSSDAYISVTSSEATAHPPYTHRVFREGAFVLFRISNHLRSFILCWFIIYLFSLPDKVRKLPGSKCMVIWFIFTSGCAFRCSDRFAHRVNQGHSDFVSARFCVEGSELFIHCSPKPWIVRFVCLFVLLCKGVK